MRFTIFIPVVVKLFHYYLLMLSSVIDGGCPLRFPTFDPIDVINGIMGIISTTSVPKHTFFGLLVILPGPIVILAVIIVLASNLLMFTVFHIETVAVIPIMVYKGLVSIGTTIRCLESYRLNGVLVD